ncbi:hypothetical protein FPOAC2_04304 [Fusarium poae]|jgi:hypothetical protein|uniref:hypothetical protein n=1 Tax=Fusarium poae TaxID=36050 RepID=UPI001CE9A501|nr:hypothetical protein FPOAC1_004234 [Fusarium poae]KAG8670998.1 hypothetical protein FPOAC1_004234 [Fusarium poae]
MPTPPTAYEPYSSQQRERREKNDKMALPGSDPFITLPSELCVQIFAMTGSLWTASRVIKASPVMLRQYLGNKMHVIRDIIQYDQDMMQDAMGILLFPCVSSPEQGLLYDRPATVIRSHIRKWSKSQLPDPLKKKNDLVISQLCKLHSRIMLLTEDYITKATAFFPPREYLCLPQVQDLSERHLFFKGDKVTALSNFTNLTTLERKRFVKAFLMYYLMAKINHLGQLPRRVPQRKVSKAEEEAVYCVVSYVKTLYGSMFAQCADAWLPTTSSVNSPESGLLYPDNFDFDANVYALDMKLDDHTRFFYSHDFGSDFERLGPDRLFDFLRHDLSKEDERQGLKAKLQIAAQWECEHRCHDVYDTLDVFFEPDKDYKDGHESSMYEHLSVELNIDSDSGSPAWKLCTQRAWVFFDDNRFYPQGTKKRPTFPSDDFLRKQSRRTQYNWDKTRALRRSQQWHEGIIVHIDTDQIDRL